MRRDIPPLDTSPEPAPDVVTCFQFLIGILRSIVELEWVDIMTKVTSEGHLES